MNDRENGDRWSGISVLAARHDDDDDDDTSDYLLKYKKNEPSLTQPAGAAKYTDSISAEG